jgi:hypothetical protein
MSKISPSVPVVGEVIPFNAGDVERTLTYWADDANVKLLGVPAGIRDSYSGREQMRGWFKKLVAQHFQIQVKIIKVRGDTVTTRTEIWSDLTRQLSIAPLVVTQVYVVNEGEIINLASTISPKAWLRFQCALQAQHEREGGDPTQEGF